MVGRIEQSDKLRCIEREIGLRKRVYPRWVAAGRMTQVEADRELEVLAAIREDYLPRTLFGQCLEIG